ncbi:RNA-directed DNA polymerase, eukaryota, reverse transcriptase zinc-binding domain protein [Tanacetum coccineum]|uniref:RNA-directed DNA polymerase, eukaryota, reverse transcriptase zinc-binding domain protein n=1 Tax=Tanacetum coccineum TaxID=301880 RepID=A0ABQ5FFK3_9ASTR
MQGDGVTILRDGVKIIRYVFDARGVLLEGRAFDRYSTQDDCKASVLQSAASEIDGEHGLTLVLDQLLFLYRLTTRLSMSSRWKECGNGVPLKDFFPRLYALDTNKDCRVNDRWRVVNGVWGGNWESRIPPRGRALDDISALNSVIGNLTLSHDDAGDPNSWTWSMDGSGKFKVRTLANCIQNITLADCDLGEHHVWNSWIPRIVNICVWRASLNKLATRTNHLIHGINIASNLCPLCDNEEEDMEHILIKCLRVLSIWRKIWSWWHLTRPSFFPSFTVKDIALGSSTSHDCPRLKKVISGVFKCALWMIWKWRNKVVNSTPDGVKNA